MSVRNIETIIAYPPNPTFISEQGPKLPKEIDPSASIEAFEWFAKEANIPEYLHPYFKATLKLYDAFNQGTHLIESFHNGYHTLAFALAAHKIFEARKNGNDPLFLKTDLFAYNNHANHTNLSMEDLELAYLISATGHDLGDILRSADTNSHGDLTAQVHQILGVNIYTSHNTEALSIEQIPVFARKFIDKSELPREIQPKFEDIIKLAQHITTQTTFEFSNEDAKQPFAFTTRIIDQLGNAACNPLGIRAIVGLLYEKYLELATKTDAFKAHTSLTREEFLSVLELIKPQHTSAPDNFARELLNEIDLSEEARKTFKVEMRGYLDFFERQGQNLTRKLLETRFGRNFKKEEVQDFFNRIKKIWPEPPHQQYINLEMPNMQAFTDKDGKEHPMTMHILTLAKRLWWLQKYIHINN